MKERLDILLVREGFFESREKAKRAIMAGIVLVNENKIDKAGTIVKEDSVIRIKGESLKYVSRGGLKLEKAVELFKIELNGKRVVDIGASTGGFTDCALQNGAKFVYSVDVGTNQLSWKLRQDSRVKSIENMHIKELKLEDIDSERADTIVVDVSFISLEKVIPYFDVILNENGELMMLIKPQFEVGKDNVDKGGIVKDFKKHISAIEEVIKCADANGYAIQGLAVSPITGTKGNVEYISYFVRKNRALELAVDIKEVVADGEKLKRGVESE